MCDSVDLSDHSSSFRDGNYPYLIETYDSCLALHQEVYDGTCREIICSVSSFVLSSSDQELNIESTDCPFGIDKVELVSTDFNPSRVVLDN